MSESAPGLRIGYVPGVTVAKWARVWAQRFPDTPLELIAVPQAGQRSALEQGQVDMCFVRLPIDRAGLHAIALYHEVAVALVPKDHPIALFDEVCRADLDGERMQDASDVDALAATVDLVAALGGAAVVPHSLARLHHRRDLIYRPLTDVEPTQIALAWPMEPPDEYPAELVQEFIGVVRGRTARSSRTAGERDRRGRGNEGSRDDNRAEQGRVGSTAARGGRKPAGGGPGAMRGRGGGARKPGRAGRNAPPRKRRGR